MTVQRGGLAGREENRVDHVNDAVRLFHVSNGDGRNLTFLIGQG